MTIIACFVFLFVLCIWSFVFCIWSGVNWSLLFYEMKVGRAPGRKNRRVKRRDVEAPEMHIWWNDARMGMRQLRQGRADMTSRIKAHCTGLHFPAQQHCISHLPAFLFIIKLYFPAESNIYLYIHISFCSQCIQRTLPFVHSNPLYFPLANYIFLQHTEFILTVLSLPCPAHFTPSPLCYKLHNRG